MAGHRSFRAQAESYLEEYLAFRRYGNHTLKKNHLRKWLSAVVAKDTVTVDDLEYLLIALYSDERKNIPKVVEALAHTNTIAISEIEDLDELSRTERPQRLAFKNRIE